MDLRDRQEAPVGCGPRSGRAGHRGGVRLAVVTPERGPAESAAAADRGRIRAIRCVMSPRRPERLPGAAQPLSHLPHPGHQLLEVPPFAGARHRCVRQAGTREAAATRDRGLSQGLRPAAPGPAARQGWPEGRRSRGTGRCGSSATQAVKAHILSTWKEIGAPSAGCVIPIFIRVYLKLIPAPHPGQRRCGPRPLQWGIAPRDREHEDDCRPAAVGFRRA